MSKLYINCDEQDFRKVSKAFKGEYESNISLSLELLFVSGDKIRELNKEHRNKDAVTDVLSFPTLNDIKGKKIDKHNYPYDIDEKKRLSIGSIVICKDRAREQAIEFGHSYERELHYLLVHGICHLLGYDHMVDDEKKEMRAKEERVLTKLKISREN